MIAPSQGSNSKEFVDGWAIAQTLGEGAYGEVKLLLNRNSGDAVAMKMIDLKKHPSAASSVKKEVAIQRNVQHPNILKFFGRRENGDIEYIFLEYAAGGELFDRIEPDVGMKQALAQRYFKQILSGVEYLHEKGITHRDLKPENILLDEHDNVKISDFGMATMFRCKGRERQLTTKCGTLPYVAPEVLVKPYDATPADTWSCGIILVTLLSGELPWDQPTSNCGEFLAWKENKYTSITPWNKLDSLALSLLRKILAFNPSDRLTIDKIQKHRWCQIDFNAEDTVDANSVIETFPRKRLCSNQRLQTANDDDVLARVCFSQPVPTIIYNEDSSIHDSNDANDCDAPTNDKSIIRNGHAMAYCFSQPAIIDNLLLSTQMNVTQCANPFQRLVKRMTRFFVSTPLDETVRELKTALDKLGFTWKCHPEDACVVVMTTDRRKMDLIYRANLIEMEGKILLDFRLSRGCGLDFKRGFMKIKEELGSIVAKGTSNFPIDKLS